MGLSRFVLQSGRSWETGTNIWESPPTLAPSLGLQTSNLRPKTPSLAGGRARKPSLCLGRTPKGAYSSRGRSRHLLETPFSEPLLRTLLRTLSYCKTHSKPLSQNPSENPPPRTLSRTFSEPFLERCVAERPFRRAPLCLLVFGFWVHFF